MYSHDAFADLSCIHRDRKLRGNHLVTMYAVYSADLISQQKTSHSGNGGIETSPTDPPRNLRSLPSSDHKSLHVCRMPLLSFPFLTPGGDSSVVADSRPPELLLDEMESSSRADEADGLSSYAIRRRPGPSSSSSFLPWTAVFVFRHTGIAILRVDPHCGESSTKAWEKAAATRRSMALWSLFDSVWALSLFLNVPVAA